MHSILFQIPGLAGGDPMKKADREKVLGIASDKIENYKGIEKLADNLWLLRADSGLPFFCCIASLAEQHQIPYRILVLEDEPKWLAFPTK